MEGLVLADLVKDPSALAENQHTFDLTGLDPETVLNGLGISVLFHRHRNFHMELLRLITKTKKLTKD
jgi:hypothetical protein